MKRIFLCDPSLTSLTGHCLGYLEAVKSVIPDGIESFFLGNKEVEPELAESRGIDPAFTFWIDHRVGSDPEVNAKSHQEMILKDLSAAGKQHGFGADDFLLINSLRHWGLLGVLRWMEGLEEGEVPEVACVLHFSALPYSDVGESWGKIYSEFFAALKISPVKERMHLFADSEALEQEYAGLGAEKIVVAPVPHVPSIPEKQPRPYLVVSYMGAARFDKGFQFLPALVKYTRETEGLPEIRFNVMAWSDNPSNRTYGWVVQQLEDDPRVELFFDPLDGDEYQALLAETDVGVVLYNKDVYASQTSGILSEYVAADAVIVASRGTWAAKQVKKYNLGALAMPDDALSMQETLFDVLSNFAEWKRRMQSGRRDFLAFHNPSNFARIVLGMNI